MIDPVEIIADDGDLYIVRECDEGGSCVVIEHFGSNDQESTQDIHLAADVVFDLGRALQQFARVKQ